MLNTTIEKGVITGESPHMILATTESLNNLSSEIQQLQAEDFVVDERREAGILFIIPTGD